MYHLFIYGIDSRKAETYFGTIGNSSFISLPAVDAIKVYKTVFQTHKPQECNRRTEARKVYEIGA